MLRLGYCVCPNCGSEHHGEGRLGTADRCLCGHQFSQANLDKIRHYWLIQISICFSLAALFLSLAIFYAQLPSDPWQRFLSPFLQIPAFSSFFVSHGLLVRHKRKVADDRLLLRYFTCGICLTIIGIIASLIKVS